jgi:mannose-1-phosphate guanylyltransferase / mannose-6-phosphate isomerase
MPKQFVSLRIDFQQVLAHISKPDLFARLKVITKSDLRFVVAEQLREHGIAANIVLEPIGRDSGPAVAVAAELAAKRDRDALALVHVVHKPDAFRDACRRTVAAAAAGWIVAFGVEPVRLPLRLYRLTGHPCGRSRRSSRSRTPGRPHNTWRTGISGTAAISCVARDHARRDRTIEPAMVAAAKAAVAGLTRHRDFLRLAAEAFAAHR